MPTNSMNANLSVDSRDEITRALGKHILKVAALKAGLTIGLAILARIAMRDKKM